MIERFAPGAGGVENVAWQVAHELARAGEDVTVLTRHSATGAGVATRRLRVPTLWQPLRVAAFSRAASRAAARERFDVVHSFSRTRHQDLYRAGGGSHEDYLSRMHPGAAGRWRRWSPRHRVLLEIERRVFQDDSQRIQCPSRLVADGLTARFGVPASRILLLPNAVDAERYGSDAALAEGRRLREAIGGGAACIWLLPGSGWRRKGLDTLLRALALRPASALRLWIAGRDDPAPWRRRAGRLGVADRVRFLGDRADLEVVYGAVDGVVLPTRYDPFANVTLEAAASGLPVVTTRANGAAEWLGDDVRALPDPDDAEALAAALADLADATVRRALGARSRERARRLDWASHANALRQEYARRIEARREAATR